MLPRRLALAIVLLLTPTCGGGGGSTEGADSTGSGAARDPTGGPTPLHCQTAALVTQQPFWAVVLGVPPSVLSILAFVWLGVTQTNRTKPWALELQRQYVADDPFTQNPAVAARFGIYTVVIWTVAIAVFIVLTMTVGWLWSWLALVGGFAVFFITLARMMLIARQSRV